MDLFDYMRENSMKDNSPLAQRMRPRNLDEVVGQRHIIGPDKLLYRAIKADKLSSIIFYGPPGTGKTTLAKVIANTTSADFRQINATVAGKKDMEDVVAAAKNNMGMYGRKTILFVDEIHRFNKGQQDYLLPFVEDGTLVRIKNGYYTDRIDRFSEEELIAKLFPDAMLCMESALYAYGYIVEKPYGWRLAVDKNTSKSRFCMEYPKVIPYYTEPEALQLGASRIEIDGNSFGIYDKERVICDCLKYESKMDRAIFKEAIQSYIKDEDKDSSLLLEYAAERKVVKKVQSLIGVWL